MASQNPPPSLPLGGQSASHPPPTHTLTHPRLSISFTDKIHSTLQVSVHIAVVAINGDIYDTLSFEPQFSDRLCFSLFNCSKFSLILWNRPNFLRFSKFFQNNPVHKIRRKFLGLPPPLVRQSAKPLSTSFLDGLNLMKLLWCGVTRFHTATKGMHVSNHAIISIKPTNPI